MIKRNVRAACVALIATLGVPQMAHAEDEAIRIVGSSTMYTFASAVAERFAQVGFKAPVVEATGSGGGFKIFCQGLGKAYPDIVTSSRPITEAEEVNCRKNDVGDVIEFKVGFDGIVLAHNRQGSSPDNVAPRDLWLALAKEVPIDGKLVNNPYTTWDQVNPTFPKSPIKIYGPPPTSGTRDVFLERVMAKGCLFFEEAYSLSGDYRRKICRQLRTDGIYVNSGESDNLVVNKLKHDPDALGLIGFSYFDQNRDTLAALNYDYVKPSYEAISTGIYALSRPLFFYVKHDHLRLNPQIQDFSLLFLSQGASGEEGFLVDRGLVPLPEEQRKAMEKKAAMRLKGY